MNIEAFRSHGHGVETAIEGTVIVPLFNHAHFVRRTMESIVQAWRPGFEVLLLDDASSDDGLSIARSVLADHPTIPSLIMRTPITGGIANLPTVLALGRGRYFVQADSDDVMLPDRLDHVSACFRDDPDCRLVTSNALLISEDDDVLALNDIANPDVVFTDPAIAAACEFESRWLGATAAYHRDVLAAFPPIDTTLCSYGFDMLTPLRALLLGRHHYIARPLVGWRLHARNAHRVAGVYASSSEERRRYAATRLMVHRQKMRDVAAIGRAPTTPGDPVNDALEESFSTAFDRWCRLETEAPLGTALTPASCRGDALPPVVGLTQGETLSLRSGTRGAAIAERWSGFHAAEDWGCWTSRNAVLSLRVAAAGRATLTIGLRSPQGARHVSLSLLSGSGSEVSLAACESCNIVLETSASDLPRIETLLVLTRDAARASDDDPSSPDTRLIGVGLASIVLGPKPNRAMTYDLASSEMILPQHVPEADDADRPQRPLATA